MSQRDESQSAWFWFTEEGQSHGIPHQFPAKGEPEGKVSAGMMEFLNPDLYNRFMEFGIKKIANDKIIFIERR